LAQKYCGAASFSVNAWLDVLLGDGNILLYNETNRVNQVLFGIISPIIFTRVISSSFWLFFGVHPMKTISSFAKSIGARAFPRHIPTSGDGRIKAIDQFRGFVIICMVIINFSSGVDSFPARLKHAPDVGLNFADLGAPMFILAIGLTFGLSFHRRTKRDGVSATYGHFIRRYLAFLGMGAIVSAGETSLGLNTREVDWGVLQAIGSAGLLTLTVILLPPITRLGIGLGLLALYQILFDRYWMGLVVNSPHGGLPGALSWGAMLIIATVLGDMFHNEKYRRYVPLASLLFVAAGFVLGMVVPVSKIRVSASYVLMTLGTSGLFFSEFYLTNFNLNYFAAWGKNSILLYGLSYLFIGIFVLPRIPAWHTQAPLWLTILQATMLVLIMGALALYWQKKGFSFSV